MPSSDTARMEVYTPAVVTSIGDTGTAASVPALGRHGRRRPTTGKAQADRKAWGKKWGRLLSEAAANVKRERG